MHWATAANSGASEEVSSKAMRTNDAFEQCLQTWQHLAHRHKASMYDHRQKKLASSFINHLKRCKFTISPAKHGSKQASPASSGETHTSKRLLNRC